MIQKQKKNLSELERDSRSLAAEARKDGWLKATVIGAAVYLMRSDNALKEQVFDLLGQ